MIKQFQTPEECLKEMGEHAWKQDISTMPFVCAVMHFDSYCSNNDKKEQCYHCPAKRRHTRKQAEVWEWVMDK